MSITWVRLYGELNDFLPVQKRKREFTVSLPHGATVKALIEQAGVPHTEVDLVLVNGESVTFSRRLAPGDRVSVYPVFESFNMKTVSRVRPEPLRITRFLPDVHLGKLAKTLRMLGFDTRYDNHMDDESIARLAHIESRIILTRDRELLKRKIVTHGYLVRSKNPDRQLVEVLERFDLFESINPFSRCLECNIPLVPVPKADVQGAVPAVVYAEYHSFSRCAYCRRIFWPGSHWEKMRQRIKALTRRKE